MAAGVDLARAGMDDRLRKIREPAGVIHMQMRQEDVPNVRRMVAQACELPYGRFGKVTGGSHEASELPHGRRRVGAVPLSPTRVDERQPVTGVNQQAVDDAISPPKGAARSIASGKAIRMHRPAIQVMDLRRKLLRTGWLRRPVTA